MRILRETPALLLLLGLLACGDKAPEVGDEDGDGYVSVDEGGDDCDDGDAAVHPGADDAWYDGVDSDCAGDDDGDADADGHAWEGAGGDDCDDADPAVHPGAEDAGTDGVDQDCDRVDGPDADGDGFAGTADDCDDGDAAVFPGAVDAFGDGVDQDCDGVDGVDGDGDGYRAVENGGLDCDDADPDVSPEATDGDTDGVDQDCDGVDGPDADGDGFADAAGGGTDCDDLDPAVHPDAVEVCGDGIDNDCDGGAGACGLEGELELSDVGIAIRSEGESFATGESVAGIGDVNGDGFDDIAVGAPGQYYSSDPGGRAYVILGPVSPNNDDELDLRFADAFVEAEGVGEKLGHAVVGLGDMDGDGYDDFAVAAPWAGQPEAYTGITYVFLGPVDGELSAAEADARLVGDGLIQLATLGGDLAAGDADGDGYADLLVGNAGFNGNSAFLVMGPFSGERNLATDADADLDGGANSNSGEGVAIGDLDGDGVDDVVVGAAASNTSTESAIFVLTEGAGGEVDLRAEAVTWTGTEWDQAGTSVAVAPDTNGDGIDDLIIGAPHAALDRSAEGAVYVVHGASPFTGGLLVEAADGTWTGAAVEDMAGVSVAGVGDTDGDGLGDVLVGACQGNWNNCGANADPGGAYLVLGGSLEGTHVLAEAAGHFRGTRESAGAGFAVAAAGDADGDGRADMLVGAPDFSEVGAAEGIVWLILGPEGL